MKTVRDEELRPKRSLTIEEVYSIFSRYSGGAFKDDLQVMYALARPYIWLFVAAVLCSAALSGINGLIAWGIKPALDMVFEKQSSTLLVLLPVGVMVLFFLRGIFVFTAAYLMNSIGAKVAMKIREAIYYRLVRLPMAFYRQNPSGTVMSKVLNDVGLMQAVFAGTVKDFIVEGSSAVVLMGVAFYRRWDLALLAFVVIPLILLSIAYLGKLMKRVSAKTRMLISDVTITLQETLQGMKVIKSFTIEEAMQGRFVDALKSHYRNTMREVRVDESSRLLSEVLGGVGIAAIMLYGGHLIMTDGISPGTFFSFVAAMLLVYTPLKRLSKVHNGFQQIRAVFERLKELMLADMERSGGIGHEIKGNISFRSVSFKYPNTEQYVLKDIDLEVSKGEIVALVGYSGAGKTTLVDLVSGFYEPTEGKILIDGVDIREIDLRTLRAAIGLVSQEVILFDDTVKANILMGRPSATMDDVIEAAKAAYAHEFIIELPEGYETNIGEHGARLSGGQRQRITIARAILRDPKILLLDEATSSLDTESEQKVQQALETLMQGRTTIVIAHRLSTVQLAHRIVVLNKGIIQQSGSHEELLLEGGLYKELYNLQMTNEK